ncbi:alpha-D-ribose 1-methylphosphonate 5-triphosphate diphosphatase [Pseudochrobactrum algeriensis]|uniref:alpha-D-ribose 1-methylphosphonate 5-triphosphate diphosphatase n=1 Tax=Pseudochrobactrum algeriensis TaxID=2834768 RepID=UPI001BCF49A4|nr:alpha-D-ribose 1-methylphosphonate 5-triphosphate diphosphatase [Pseudochrobactrum algeriensis]MBX8813026.1 alpha-D-ribose 1-methylphosphonate 5-triphosphate diphosphatase [Ochrobactrum sp. MR34]QVQ37116.1 alpha-D-ribose 1-methylphosphonate 5-triphosphate diphosphatase [Pseudochrobactrum algeriensis]QVQ40333.1 alpha-D-ribose 1-methylphosphonate 5-triphosphate diphosphatase [Pseudochrobactrum algeriensis]QVQ44256.1 alpha-D-ribose 1-methylphosphonate 5-triphosphate diphosphatase [Pseudochrobac
MTRDTRPSDIVFKNARIILEDEVITGTIQIRDGKIADISSGNGISGEDFGGDYLMPGVVELHTDHLEQHYAPRPKVRWNADAALMAHDAQIAASGITTVFDALRVGLDGDTDINSDDMVLLADAIADGQNNGRLRADHYLHLRCEVSSPNCLDAFELFEHNPQVKIASLMDHAPGQRQFASLEAYKTYYMGKQKMTQAEFDAFCDRRVAESVAHADRFRKEIAARCQAKGISLASHDDATLAHVDEAIEQGIHVAEFPTTLEAAKASKEAGMAVLMGAPNIVRGSSHSGNVSARDLASAGHLDILSSDYIPFSLVQAVYTLPQLVDGYTLPQAINLVTRNPAKAVGFTDRGTLASGKRADMVRVHIQNAIPVVRSVWREGQRVL